MEKRAFKWTIHTVLFSIYPVVFAFSHNIAKIPVRHVVLPISITLGLGLAVWLIAGLVFRSVVKGALVSSLSVMALLFYKHVYVALEHVSGWSPGHGVALTAWLILYVAGLLAVGFAREATAAALSRIAVVVSLALVAVACAPIVKYVAVYYPFPQRPARDDEALRPSMDGWSRLGGEHPDIYYIILDAYARADMLKKHFGFDNSEFLARLEARGFFVAGKSTANYTTTFTSLRSSLNMAYHDDPLEIKGLYSIRENRVAALLRAAGYKCVVVPSGFNVTNDSFPTDVKVDVGTSTRTELSAFLLEWSVLCVLFDGAESPSPQQPNAARTPPFLDLTGTVEWYRHIKRSIEAIGDRANARGPQFVFAHIICPHGPFVFNRDGSFNPASRMTDLSSLDKRDVSKFRKLYIDQMVHLNSLVDAMIEKILKNSRRPPIIIIQSDHGTFTSGDARSPENPSAQLIRERMANFFACHAPKAVRNRLYHSITPVNIFRIIFNEEFGAPYELRKDRNFWSHVKPYREVTAIATESGHWGH